MSYVNHRRRVFMHVEDNKPIRRRSEGRMKTYPSETDLRSWGDTVEERRQHILDLVNKDMNKCMGNLIPLDALIKALTGDASVYQKCLNQLWAFIKGLQLSAEDERKLQALKSTMHTSCKEIGGASGGAGTIITKTKGPARIITRIKGIEPGFSIEGDSSPRDLSVKAQGPFKNTMKVKDAYPLNAVPQRMNNTTDSQNIKEDIGSLKDKQEARAQSCDELRNTIKKLQVERDELQEKLTSCLQEIDKFKKLNTAGVSQQNDNAEFEALGLEIDIMGKDNFSPEEDARTIQQEVEFLRSNCAKLKAIEEENEKLKQQLKSQTGDEETFSTPTGEIMETNDPSEISCKDTIRQLKTKVAELEAMTKERDTLANKVHQLETQLKQYQDLPDDIDMLRTRSQMLDGVLAERDNMSKKVGQMKDMEDEIIKLRNRASKVDDLERELKSCSKNDIANNYEHNKTLSRCATLANELQNLRSERDAMAKRIDQMKRESDSHKFTTKENEMLKLERDRLQIKLNELSDMQTDQDDMMFKMNAINAIKEERDTYKQKYEDLLQMECKCEELNIKVEKAKKVENERDALQKKVSVLEECICKKEHQIQGLVGQLGSVSRDKELHASRMNSNVASMRCLLEEKDRLIASSQDKLANVQAQLKATIQGVTCETTCLKAQVNELEKLLAKAEQKITEKEFHIECLEKEILEHTSSLQISKKINRSECESMEAMRKELELAKAENKKLQEIAKKMVSLTDDEHKKMLRQSQCAAKKVIEELGKQHRDHQKMCKKVKTDSEENNSKNEDVKKDKSNIPRMLCHCAQLEVADLQAEKEDLQMKLDKEMDTQRALEQKINEADLI